MQISKDKVNQNKKTNDSLKNNMNSQPINNLLFYIKINTSSFKYKS